MEVGVSECRGCGAPVSWARTARGKHMPLDPEPHPEGNVEVDAGVATVVDPAQKALFGERYMPHWATCPRANDFRGNA